MISPLVVLGLLVLSAGADLIFDSGLPEAYRSNHGLLNAVGALPCPGAILSAAGTALI